MANQMQASVSWPRTKLEKIRLESDPTSMMRCAARRGRYAYRIRLTFPMIFSLPNSRYMQKIKPIAVMNTPFAMEVVTTTTESIRPVVSSVALVRMEDQSSLSELIWSCVILNSLRSLVISPERRLIYKGALSISTCSEETNSGTTKTMIAVRMRISVRNDSATQTPRRHFSHSCEPRRFRKANTRSS